MILLPLCLSLRLGWTPLACLRPVRRLWAPSSLLPALVGHSQVASSRLTATPHPSLAPCLLHAAFASIASLPFDTPAHRPSGSPSRMASDDSNLSRPSQFLVETTKDALICFEAARRGESPPSTSPSFLLHPLSPSLPVSLDSSSCPPLCRFCLRFVSSASTCENSPLALLHDVPGLARFAVANPSARITRCRRPCQA